MSRFVVLACLVLLFAGCGDHHSDSHCQSAPSGLSACCELAEPTHTCDQTGRCTATCPDSGDVVCASGEDFTRTCCFDSIRYACAGDDCILELCNRAD